MNAAIDREASLPFWVGSLFGVAVTSAIVGCVLQLGAGCSAF